MTLRGVLESSLALAVATAYSGAILLTHGDPLLVILPIALATFVVVMQRPIVGLYVALGAAVLFEQWPIDGLQPITAQTHFFDNISGFTSLDLRFSAADLLLVSTLAAMLLSRRREPLQTGPVGLGVGLYFGSFVLGAVVGYARGGQWNDSATLAELRGPAYLAVTYFLCVNLVKTREEMMRFAVILVGLVGVKAFEAMANALTMFELGTRLEAVTSHEDVVFFDVVAVLALAAPIVLGRTRATYALLAVVPPIAVAELLTQRRVAFVALAAAVIAVILCLVAVRRRLTLALVIPGAIAAVAYGAVFWSSDGALAQPVRAVRGIVQPQSLSERDRLSNVWRDIENANISFTLRDLPLTGVGLGQQYFFREEPPELTGFVYWRYMTHNAVYWVWLKGGILGFAALWMVLARAVITSTRLVMREREPLLRLIALLPMSLVIAQVVYSSVDLGLTYSRPMIVLGIALGLLAPLAGAAAAARAPHRRTTPLMLQRVAA